jgi:Zn-dependent protease with chaperone function
MRYCVNCGASYKEPSALCPRCHFDERVPEELVDAALAKPVSEGGKPRFRYPGEKAALLLSVLASVVVAALLGTVSLGLFAIIVVLSLVDLKLSHIASRSNMIAVSARSFPLVHRLSKLAAYRLRIPIPESYVKQDPTYNAFTRGFFRDGFIVLHSRLVEDFEPRELLFVIGHEMGHMKRLHTTWLTLLNPAAGVGARMLLAPLIRLTFNVWSVKAEYTADQGGLIGNADPEGACRALLKLAGGVGAAREVSLEAVTPATEDPGALGGLVEYLGDHPFIRNRVIHAMHYAASRDFKEACWWARE